MFKLLLIGIIYFGLWIIHFKYIKEKKLNDVFNKTIADTNSNILYITNNSWIFYFLGKLRKFIINIDEEDTTSNFAKRLHKIKGHLILIIDFSKVDQQKIIPLIRALHSYSTLPGNTLTTYVPYKTKDSASILALAGKTIIMGNYATISGSVLEQTIIKLMETNYGTKAVKKLVDNFFVDNASNCHTCEDLIKSNFNCIIEEKVKDKLTNIDPELLRNLMSQIEKLSNFSLSFDVREILSIEL